MPPRPCHGATLAAALGLVAVALLPVPGRAAPRQRFFVAGPGAIDLRSTKGRRFAGRYRTADGRYLPAALRRIDRVLGAPGTSPAARVSLRLVERLAYLQGKLGARAIIVSSGYRSPRYNERLRDKGRTVAQASLHQYGMAVDLRLEGVESAALWRYAKEHGLGGAGYYGSPWVHLDTGPPRYWTQGTANVRTGISEHNKRIILVPEYDVYAAGETVTLRFARMTAYPIGVQPRLALERAGRDDTWTRVTAAAARFAGGAAKPGGACRLFGSIAAMAGVRYALSAELPAGRYRITAAFCDVRWPEMPARVASYVFEVRP